MVWTIFLIFVITVALVLNRGKGALKTLFSGNAEARPPDERETRICAAIDLLALPGQLIEATFTSLLTLVTSALHHLFAAICGGLRYLWSHIKLSIKALFEEATA